MNMTLAAHHPNDAALLRQYAEQRTEEAFAELVRRNIDLVHSAALRQLSGNAASAADVTQAVFTELARHADRLARHPALTGWLYTITHHLATRHIRSETRRQRREQEAHAMQELLQEPAAEPATDWTRLRPVLDAAMHDLGETDRLAVLLRHFEQRPLAEVGARLGLSENAARMRVDRALDKLHAKLAKRGVTSTAAALAVALSGQAVTAAPATLTAFVTTSALATAATTTSAFGLLSVMASTQFKLSLTAVLITATLTGVLLQQRTLGQLHAENSGLAARLTQLSDNAEALRSAASRKAASLTRTGDQAAELLRLQAEVARLRANQSAKLATAPTPPEDEDDWGRGAWNQFVDPRMAAAGLLAKGLRLTADRNHGQPTDSLADVVHELELDEAGQPPEFRRDTLKKVQRRHLLEHFEFLFQGSYSNIVNPASGIVVREREPWKTKDGPWMRTYGFAAGTSGVIISSEDGDFSAWEAQHQVQTGMTNAMGPIGQ